MKIAFFDSGMGGLTVLQDAVRYYPSAHYIYFADTENVPYGTKTKKEIHKLVDKAVHFLSQKDIDILVLACNTATSVSVKKLRKKYNFPIVGMEPAVKPATELKRQRKKILVCATKLTIKEDKLKHLISNLNANDDVKLLALGKLVRYAEKQEFESKRVTKYLEQKFEDIDWSEYKAIVLGCTHFVYFRKAIRSASASHIKLIDGNLGTVRRMLHLLPENKKQKKLKISYYRSMKKAKEKTFEPYASYYNSNLTDDSES